MAERKVMMNPERVKALLADSGAIIEGHFVGTSGKHLSHYVAKDRATRLPSVVSELCSEIAEIFAGSDVDVVVAPAVGGIALSQWTAFHLTRLRPDRPEAQALYSEPDDREIDTFGSVELSTAKGEVYFCRHPEFKLKRGFGKDVRDKRVLVVEDTLTTGGSARKTIEAVLAESGKVVGLGVLVNGGDVTAKDCRVDRLEALMTINRQVFTAEECAQHGLCSRDVPVNTDFGHGADFLAKRQLI